mgnify:CR=1 FL=1
MSQDDRSYTHAHTAERQRWRKIARGWNLTIGGEPLLPTNRFSRHELLQLADAEPDDTFDFVVDDQIGCDLLSIDGDGYVIEIVGGCCHISNIMAA